jgi:hypothetical protein
MSCQTSTTSWKHARRRRRLNVRGDGAKVDTIVPHSGAASFHSPAGDTVTGGEAVAKRYLRDAAAFHDNGSSRFDVLQQGESGSTGFWTGFQFANVQIGDMPEAG